ncbi:SET family sugar efflux transporter-like MFS transporter [Orbus hercynius]|uniref:SET family sugar efflux transporter-like MFS transporter n=1 Tax=Orbus hercynius TaxID=593135 RepID=A0A495RIX4_9GAMM|nr:sugar efflux transporter [Orbus hercynius]RKS87395.1 SET family sugar efflux transporter-like MFS transporter [Orbus hercynius]
MLFSQKKLVIFAAFLISTFIIGIAGALQAPTLSRFLSYEINVGPVYVGLFYSINAMASIIGSFWVAKYSDKKSKRRDIVIFCCLMGMANSLTFAFTRHYFVLIMASLCFASLASAAMPQIFALAREYAVKTGRNVVTFNSLIRAQLSLAWVIGPPLSFALAVNYGFTTMYLCAVVMYLVAMLVIVSFLPIVDRNPVNALDIASLDVNPDIPLIKNKSVVFLFLATVFMWTANMMYLIDMPLYIDSVLHLSTSLPGFLMGMAAGIEIPVMLIAGYLVPYVGKRNLMLAAIVCGALFYIGLLLFTHEFALLALQILNALFIGIVANIGIIYFQDLLPTRIGVASTLFNNGVTCSVIIGGLMQGIISDWYGHHVIYSIALVMLIISFFFCLQVKSDK